MNSVNIPSGIQIIGTQRSGSNLLRVILDQSSEIASPHPAHVLVNFIPLLELYGEMNECSYKALINDVVDYVLANPVPWDGVVPDKDWIYENSKVYTLFEINKLIYEAAALTKKAKYWCCKSMANIHYAAELESHSPDLKYIYLYRDGRDVALSFKKAIVGEKHIFHLAQQWNKDQQACLALSKYKSSKHFFSLNYEDLTAEPELIIKSLCSFLDISFSEEMLQFYNSKESKATAAAGEMWQNLEKPILKNNKEKFRNELKMQEIELFEIITKDVLMELGYPLYSNHSNLQLISDEAIQKYAIENEIMKKDILVKARQSDLDRRDPQLQLLKNIKKQLTEV